MKTNSSGNFSWCKVLPQNEEMGWNFSSVPPNKLISQSDSKLLPTPSHRDPDRNGSKQQHRHQHQQQHQQQPATKKNPIVLPITLSYKELESRGNVCRGYFR